MADGAFVVAMVGGGRVVAPGIDTAIGVAGCFFPFELSREAFVSPGGVGLGIAEGDEGDGVVGDIRGGLGAAPMFGWGVVSGLDKLFIFGIGDGGGIDPIFVEEVGFFLGAG